MFEFFRGILYQKSPNYIVLDVHGAGYKLFIPLNAHVLLPEIGQQTLLYASFVVREDSQTLYGFLKREEKDLFELLLTVSGIGPKTALALIGHIDLATFQQALQTHNVAWIAKTPGIGKKTAERLIIELKDKLKVDPLFAQQPGIISDAMGALIHLGYSVSISQKAVQAAYEEKQHEENLGRLITQALQKMKPS